MQKQFLKWLLIVVFTAFLVTFCTSFIIQTRQSHGVGVDLIKLKIEDVKNQLNVNKTNLSAVEQMTYNSALVKAKTLAWMVYKNPSIINNQNELENVKKILDVDELHVSDKDGILIASIPMKYRGFDMKSSEQTKEFMPAISNPDFELVQEPRLRGAKDDIFQYAGVARIAIPGLIEIGYKPQRLEDAQKLADIKNISDGFRIGKSGSIIILENDEIISYGTNNKDLSTDETKKVIENSKKIQTPFDIQINKIKYTALADIWKNYTIVGLLPKSEMYLSRDSILQVLVLANFILFGVIFFLISLLLQNIVISGIYKVNKSLGKITKGDLREKVNVKNVEEFQMLSDGINTTVDALRHAIDAEAKRLEKELELAKSIQISALPKIFPPYPEHNEFDIYALMCTAKEVGGDFYDFFFINPNHFAFLIADVSGKGIPAALFMMTSKTLIKNLAKTGISPEKLMTKVNRQICKTNDQGFFVTVFLCVLELSTGKVTYVNAGHNPPLIKRTTGDIEYLKCRPNLVIGAMDNVEYVSEEIQLNPNDSILLYTDGITEAVNENDELYGEEKLKKLLEQIVQTAPPKGHSAKEVLDKIKNNVDDFANGREQADDITMLGLKYIGFENLDGAESTSILLDATVEKFPNLISWLENLCEQLNMSQTYKTKLQIAVEEIFVNISSYAYPPKDGKVEIIFQISAENQIEMQFVDNGTPYNPLEAADPDITLSADERPIGGLGIFMVKKTMDFTGYEFEAGKNILTIRMNYK